MKHTLIDANRAHARGRGRCSELQPLSHVDRARYARVRHAPHHLERQPPVQRLGLGGARHHHLDGQAEGPAQAYELRLEARRRVRGHGQHKLRSRGIQRDLAVLGEALREGLRRLAMGGKVIKR